jgi:hypothetical protein
LLAPTNCPLSEHQKISMLEEKAGTCVSLQKAGHHDVSSTDVSEKNVFAG